MFVKRMFRNQGKTLAASVILVILLTLGLTAGCSALRTDTPTPTAAPRQPFSARSESEDGAVVFWKGYTDGYQAGEESSFEVQLKNNTEQPWQGRFCLQLLSPDSALVIQTLAQEEINLESGVGFSDELTVTMPETLDQGSYHLSMVVRRPSGPMVDMIPIQVGSTDAVLEDITQEDMDAALEACPPVEGAGQEVLVEQAVSDLSERLEVDLEEIEVKSVEAAEFSDASLGVPEPGKTYAQVITPGYIIQLEIEGKTYRYHASQSRVVFVPEEGTPTAPAPTSTVEDEGAIEIPEAGSVTTLPLHIMAYVGEPGMEITAVLRWDDGTELSQTFTTLESPEGEGLLIESLDWQTESTPPQPETDQATLILQTPSGQIVGENPLTILGADHPQTRLIDLYWLLGEELESEQRRVVDTGSVESTAVKELLWGPPPRNLAGFQTAIPTPEDVLGYPGRGEDWGPRVRMLGLTIEEGTARVNFSQEMRAYGGGSARVQSIRQQIIRTLAQFDSVDTIVIAVEGETEGVLQP